MRQRLLFITLALVICSLASGFGLRYAWAVSWVEPYAAPPDGNVPAPINIGSGAQTKTGDLTIGGSFVVGAPAGGAEGAGSINAQKVCINGDCLTSWAGGQAFVQNGNSFGAPATLGTNDPFDLAFKTNNSEKMRLDTNGNLGIGTNAPHLKLEVNSGATTINGQILLANSGTYHTGIIGTSDPANYLTDSHAWGIYGGPNNYLSGNAYSLAVVLASGVPDFRITANNNLNSVPVANGYLFTVQRGGNVGIGTNDPHYKLTVAGTAPREYLWPSGNGNPELDFGDQAAGTHWGIYRSNSDNTSDLRFWYGTSAGAGNNNVIMTTQGDIDSSRCFGPVYAGQTGAVYNGARGGYASANGLCGQFVPGSHVCTTSEILETIKCNQASLPVTDQAWISNGPPGYTARANDCTGWTSSSPAGDGSTVYGAIWAFDANGGVGWVTTCNQTLKFACCK